MDLDKIKIVTQELIKYKTVRPGKNPLNNKSCLTNTEDACFIGEINDCMNYVQNKLHHSIIIERVEEYVDDVSCPILIAKFRENKNPELLIIGHIDVVAGVDSQFIPFEKNGKIYGRGAKDMKAGIAAMIEIMNNYAEKKLKPNIAIAVVSDEESGGAKGTNLIVNKSGYKPRYVITPDPGERHCIINKEKGFIWFSITVFGKSSHPSRPWLGKCAFNDAVKIWKEIESEFNIAKSEDDWKTSASITSFNKLFEDSSGTYCIDNSPSVSGIVKFRIDIRYTENENPEEIKSQLQDIVKKNNPENLLKFESIAPVCFTPDDNEFHRAFKKCADSIEGFSVPVLVSAGASDMRFFSAKNIPCLTYGPKGGNHHAADEYVEIDSIAVFTKTVIKFIDEKCNNS